MGIDLDEENVRKLFENKELFSEIFNKMLEDPKVVKSFAEEIRKAIAKAVENDPEFKERLVRGAIKSEEFSEKAAKALISD